MKKTVKIIYLFLVCLTVVMLFGCGKKKETTTEVQLADDELYIYYVDNGKTKFVPRVYRKKTNQDVLQQIDTLVKFLGDNKNVPENEIDDNGTAITYRSPIFDGITYKNCQYGNRTSTIELFFDMNYENLDAQSLLFFKGCVVKSIFNLGNIRTVNLYMTDIANTDIESATALESFDVDSFLVPQGDFSGYQQKGMITVYFANADATALKEYQKSVEISNNTSLATLVIETLLAGPETEGYQATISEGTTIKSISVKDGVCYIDLSDEFYDVDNPIKNDLIVYSIVDSLVELPTVSKVQFLKDGSKVKSFRESMPFDGVFERNLNLVEQDDAIVKEEQSEEELESEVELQTDK